MSNPCGCQQQQQQQHPKAVSLTVSALTHNITTFFAENHKILCETMWTAGPVSKRNAQIVSAAQRPSS